MGAHNNVIHNKGKKLETTKASTDGKKIVLTFKENIGTSNPDKDDFTVTSNGLPVTPKEIKTDGNTITLTLQDALVATANVNISYKKSINATKQITYKNPQTSPIPVYTLSKPFENSTMGVITNDIVSSSSGSTPVAAKFQGFEATNKTITLKFDKDKIYEVHGTMKSLQCMDKKCCLRNGIIEMTEAHIPMVDENTLIGSNLPSCPYCSNILRPNVSMFGDYDFYGKPYEFARKKMELWLKENEQNGKKIVILEIGCGINPHSLRMYNVDRIDWMRERYRGDSVEMVCYTWRRGTLSVFTWTGEGLRMSK